MTITPRITILISHENTEVQVPYAIVTASYQQICNTHSPGEADTVAPRQSRFRNRATPTT